MSRIGYFEGQDARNNVFSFLERNLAASPEREVLRWVDSADLARWDGSSALPHRSIRMSEFVPLARRIAAGLADQGITAGDRVILFVPMSVALYSTLSALQCLGAIPVFLDSWARRNQMGASARIAGPRAIVTFERAMQAFQDVPEILDIPIRLSVGQVESVPFQARLEDLMKTAREASPVPVEREHTALITFTTGSSGTPKGANRTHRFLAAQHYALNACLPYEPGDVDLPVFPIFSLNNIAAGVTTVIPAIDVGQPGARDAEVLIAQFHATGVTCTTLSPSLLNGVSAYGLEKGIRLEGLRRIATGGAPISRDDLIRITQVAPRAETWVLYGSTEVEPMAHVEAKEMIAARPPRPAGLEDDPEWVDEGVNVGHMADGLRYRFLKITKDPVHVRDAADWSRIEAAPGQVGELVVSGEHVCRDYYNDPGAFSRAKIRDENGDVWHRTGDLGRLDGHGSLWIVGRVHNAIQRGGQPVFPVRAEIILKKLPFTRHAAYLGLDDARLGSRAACVIVPRDPESLGDAAELVRRESELRRLMTKNGMPVDQVFFRAEIPMDPRHHSKVEYDALRAQLEKEKS